MIPSLRGGAYQQDNGSGVVVVKEPRLNLYGGLQTSEYFALMEPARDGEVGRKASKVEQLSACLLPACLLPLPACCVCVWGGRVLFCCLPVCLPAVCLPAAPARLLCLCVWGEGTILLSACLCVPCACLCVPVCLPAVCLPAAPARLLCLCVWGELCNACFFQESYSCYSVLAAVQQAWRAPTAVCSR